ncbi:MAG: hypothetical protein QOG50_1684 [Actinomycetota bacterium]|nr:hypothetical protein [Actinomycetota bacterium]
MHRSLKGAIGAGIVGGAAYAVWRAWNTRVPRRPNGLDWSTAPFPFPPVPRPGGAPSTDAPPNGSAPAGSAPGSSGWREPADDGSCPASFPIKAKLGSGIYHPPGGVNYERTKADRCYADPGAAEADGLRPSKV